VLAPVNVAKYVLRVSAERVAAAMRKHPYAQSAVAESMMSRLEADMEKLAKHSETSTVPELRLPDGRALSAVFVSGAAGAAADTTLTRADFDVVCAHYVELERRLVALKTADSEFVTAAVPVIVAAANDTSAAPVGRERDAFLLLRLSRQRTPLWLQYTIASMLSTGDAGAAAGEVRLDDWRQQNPFVRGETFRVAMQLTTRAASRTASGTRTARSSRAASCCARPSVLVAAALGAGLVQQSSTLASLLDTNAPSSATCSTRASSCSSSRGTCCCARARSSWCSSLRAACRSGRAQDGARFSLRKRVYTLTFDCIESKLGGARDSGAVVNNKLIC
jgi:hypothetical protein